MVPLLTAISKPVSSKTVEGDFSPRSASLLNTVARRAPFNIPYVRRREVGELQCRQCRHYLILSKISFVAGLGRCISQQTKPLATQRIRLNVDFVAMVSGVASLWSRWKCSNVVSGSFRAKCSERHQRVSHEVLSLPPVIRAILGSCRRHQHLCASLLLTGCT